MCESITYAKTCFFDYPLYDLYICFRENMSCIRTQILWSEQAMEEEKRVFLTFLSSSVLCFLLLLICNTQAINAASTSSQRDHVALMAFRLSIEEDPSGVLRSWNESVSVCNWEGITCSRRHGRVTSLDLGSRQLVGSLSPSIGNMSFLRVISLVNNSFQGEIPSELGHLIRLEVLNLSRNSFEGQIPSNLSYCSNLIALNVGWNKLSGKLPAELGSLSRLRQLSLSFNQFTGEIPPVIGNLTSLEILSFSRNDFQGEIPASLGRLKNLTFLALGGNKLTGTIPKSIYNLTSVTEFSVASNQLYGTVPSDIGLTIPNLQIFEMWGNYFTGSIPTSLSNASKIERLDMGQNNLTGKIAVDFWNLQQLNYLNFVENSLGSGDEDELNFISSLTNCSNLEHLFVSDNQLKGVLPASVANLSIQLKTLAIARNQISGALPPKLVRLESLNALVVEENYLTGPIPADIGRLQNLQVLRLHNNRFSGEIPSSIGNLSWLSRVFLDGNELNGTIPSSFGDCQNLLVLSLSYNYLSGLIPKELFAIPSLAIGLNLQYNLLVGSLPPEIGRAIKLVNLYLSKNNLSGEIPGNLGKCTSLVDLYMNGNSFQGDIPPSFASLRALQNLDLSGNNLSGKIPNFLESFSLEYLNLSSNNFEGEVPVKGVFGNTSAVSVEGNNKLCGGILELKLPRCPSGGSKESKRGKGFPVKTLMISISSAILGVAMICSFLYYWFKKRTRNQSSESSQNELFRRVSYETLRKATDGFSPATLVGMGAFGSVYRGILDEDGEAVAVKVLNLKERGASKSFAAECEALRNTRHRNLVKVITACSSIDFQGNEFKALVYEFLPNGSLEKWLHPVDIERIQLRNLNFVQRMNIAIDVASALDYLHHHCQEPIIHCDIKPSNILLDSEMNARVGDFGLARFLPQIANLNESSSIGVRGTIGYTPPEYGLGNELSTKGDVYSYGILLLEMVTGKKPTDDSVEKGGNLHNLARMALPDQVLEVLDPVLLNEDEATADSETLREMRTRYDQKVKCLESMVKIGVQCSKESPQDRPDISDVLSELRMIRDSC